MNTTYYVSIETHNVAFASKHIIRSEFTTDTCKHCKIITYYLIPNIITTVSCGDGVCDVDHGEDCSNCFFDCGACSMNFIINNLVFFLFVSLFTTSIH